MSDVGKILIVAGLAIAALGAIIWLLGQAGVPLGRLPGDISVERPGFKFYFPVVTCLLLSVALSALVWWLNRR